MISSIDAWNAEAYTIYAHLVEDPHCQIEQTALIETNAEGNSEENP